MPTPTPYKHFIPTPTPTASMVVQPSSVTSSGYKADGLFSIAFFVCIIPLLLSVFCATIIAQIAKYRSIKYNKPPLIARWYVSQNKQGQANKP